MTNPDANISLFDAGEISPDDLFDPIWAEAAVPSESGAMSRWDTLYQRRTEESTPAVRLLSYEDTLELAETIKKSRVAKLVIQSMDETNYSGPNRDKSNKQVELGEQARELLVASHLRLAAWFVRQTMDFHKKSRMAIREPGQRGRIVRSLSDLSGGHLEYDDRMQIASLGLVTAAETFTGQTAVGKKVNFASWALWRMEGELLKAMDDSPSSIHMQSEVLYDIRHMTRAQKDLMDEGNVDPSYENIAERLSIPSVEVIKRRQRQTMRQPISLEAIQEFVATKASLGIDSRYLDESGQQLSLSDLIVDDGTVLTIADEASEDSFSESIDSELASILSPRQVQVLQLHFEQLMTLNEVGKIVGMRTKDGGFRSVSGSTARRVESDALYLLRYDWGFRELYNDSEPFKEEDPQFGLRPIIRLDEFEDAELGIDRPAPEQTSTSRPITRYTNARSYTLAELEDLKRKGRY